MKSKHKSRITTRIIAQVEKLMYLYLPYKHHPLNREEDQLIYWKNVLFAMFATLIICFGGPAFLYGSLLFVLAGQYIQGIIEMSSFVLMCFVLLNRHVPLNFKKYTVLFVLYGIAIMLIITTGPFGAGMITALFALTLSGLFFESKQVRVFFVINLASFAVLSYFVFSSLLEDYPLQDYRHTWWINLVSLQFIGFMLLSLGNTVMHALDRQNLDLLKSRRIIAHSDAKHRDLVAHLTDVVTVVDNKGLIVYASPNIHAQLESEHQALESIELVLLFHPDVHEEIRTQLQSVFSGVHHTVTFNVKTPSEKHFEMTVRDMTDNVHIEGYLISLYNITKLMAREQEILYLYERDPLTGLRNRQNLETYMASLNRVEHLPLSILYGDINGLKIINDALGHAVGDQLLKAIADILTRCCEPEHRIFRIGGDEFLIFQENTTEQQSHKLMAKIHAMCESYNVTHGISNGPISQKSVINPQAHSNVSPFYLSISLGVSMVEDLETSVESAVYLAEEAMYKRKLIEDHSFHSGILSAMLNVLEDKSPDEAEHGNRLAYYARCFGQALKLNHEDIEACALVARLHDIGKVGIDGNILEKSTILTKDDWEHLKRHPEIGYRIAINSHELTHVADAIYAHHERWDGRGYPRNLVGAHIPLIARIIAILDAYDAITHERSYRAKKSHLEAIEELKSQRGLQFDPDLVDAFVRLLIENPTISSFENRH